MTIKVELLSTISHEQVLSYEPNCLNCIRVTGGKEKKKIYVQIENYNKFNVEVAMTLKYETIKLKKEREHIGFKPHESQPKFVTLMPLEKKIRSN